MGASVHIPDASAYLARMNRIAPIFETGLVTGEQNLDEVQRLRHRVFVQELGAHDPGQARETDRFDGHARHLVLRDLTRPEGQQIVGVYRLMTSDDAARAGGFSSAAEYDLAPLEQSGRPLLELGRSCVHPDYRGGTGLLHLWQGLAAQVAALGSEILFGVASFHGADHRDHAAGLALLHQDYLAPTHLRPQVRKAQGVPMALDRATVLDRKAALASLPPLIKAYLRIGGRVGEGAWQDHGFNTTDVCMVVDVAAMSARDRARYQGAA